MALCPIEEYRNSFNGSVSLMLYKFHMFMKSYLREKRKRCTCTSTSNEIIFVLCKCGHLFQSALYLFECALNKCPSCDASKLAKELLHSVKGTGVQLGHTPCSPIPLVNQTAWKSLFGQNFSDGVYIHDLCLRYSMLFMNSCDKHFVPVHHGSLLQQCKVLSLASNGLPEPKKSLKSILKVVKQNAKKFKKRTKLFLKMNSVAVEDEPVCPVSNQDNLNKYTFQLIKRRLSSAGHPPLHLVGEYFLYVNPQTQIPVLLRIKANSLMDASEDATNAIRIEKKESNKKVLVRFNLPNDTLFQILRELQITNAKCGQNKRMVEFFSQTNPTGNEYCRLLVKCSKKRGFKILFFYTSDSTVHFSKVAEDNKKKVSRQTLVSIISHLNQIESAKFVPAHYFGGNVTSRILKRKHAENMETNKRTNRDGGVIQQKKRKIKV